MPLVTIQAPSLSSDQKRRIGDRIIEALHGEGLHASSVVVLFKREDADLLLDGGLLIEAAPASAPILCTPSLPVQPSGVSEPEPVVESRRSRPKKGDLADLKERLARLLQQHGALSSFQAQDELDLRDCDWASATLRGLFSELEAEGVLVRQGQKRGTRYVWQGITSQPKPDASAILVKKGEDDLG